MCLGLIYIESDMEVVRLMYPTLEEYLKSSQKLFDNPEVKTSRILLTYMRFPEPRQWLEKRIDESHVWLKKGYLGVGNDLMLFNDVFPFLQYTCEFWNQHAMMSERELELDIWEYFHLRPWFLLSLLDDSRNLRHMRHLCRELRNPSISEPWIELVYSIINLFGDVVLQLIARGVAFQAVYENLSLPTALSWLPIPLPSLAYENQLYWKGSESS